MSLLKRSALIRNLLVFITASILHYQVLVSREQGVFALEWEAFSNIILADTIISALYILSFISIFNAWRVSKLFLAALVFIISIKGITLFAIDFDKTTLLLNFCYIVFGFYFNLAWKMELDESIYRPGFSKNDIGKKSEYDFPVQIKNTNGETSTGYLTNWDELGCFINFEQKDDELRGVVEISINCFGRSFEHTGHIMTSYGNGVGIKFLEASDPTGSHSWFEFYDIVNDRGYCPRYQRV